MSKARPGRRTAHAAADVAWPPAGLAKPAQRALAGTQIASLERLATFSESEIAALHGMGPNALAVLFLTARSNPLPDRFVGAPILEKPFSRPRLLEALSNVMAAPKVMAANVMAEDELPYAISPPSMSWLRVLPQL